VLTVEGTYTSGDREGITVSHEIDFGTMQIKRNYLYKVRIALEDPAGNTYGKVTHAINVKDWTSGVTLAWAGDENLYNKNAAANFTVTGTAGKLRDADADNLERHFVNPFNAEKSATFYVTSTSTKSGLSLTCPATAVAATAEEGGGYQCTITPQANTYNENGEFTQKWAVTIRESALPVGTILTFTLQNALNSALSASFEVVGRSIRMNPLWWVSEYYVNNNWTFDKTNNTSQGYLMKQTVAMNSNFVYQSTSYDGWKDFPESTDAARTIEGVVWHVPTKQEAYSIFPGISDSNAEWFNNTSVLKVANTSTPSVSDISTEYECVFGFDGTTKSGVVPSSYWSAQNSGTRYAIRFIGTNYCSAWRYQFLGTNGSTDRRLVISSRLISPIPITDADALATELKKMIPGTSYSDDSYWDDAKLCDEHFGVKRIFYICGHCATSNPGQHAPGTDDPGNEGFFWTTTEANSSEAWNVYYYSGTLRIHMYKYSKEYPFSIRLFRDK